VLKLLAEEGYVKLEHYFVDGTKIEASANRYTFVWGKTVAKQQVRLDAKKAVRLLRKDLLRKQKYELQQKLLGERNS